jgi:hypothetical protein
MSPLKLTRLPDRKLVRLTIKINPDLNRALEQYTEVYNAAYGEKERLAVLIPHILESFLVSDRVFAKATKAKIGEDGTSDLDLGSRERKKASSGSSSSETKAQ